MMVSADQIKVLGFFETPTESMYAGRATLGIEPQMFDRIVDILLARKLIELEGRFFQLTPYGKATLDVERRRG